MLKISVLAPMNFDYSYRAFLITSLLTGILVLTLVSVKMSNVKDDNTKAYDVEVAEKNIVIPDKVEEKLLSMDNVKIETNKAYNSAEKYLSKLENENTNLTETTEGKLQEMNEAISNSENDGNNKEGISPIKKSESKSKTSNGSEKNNTQTVAQSGNRNTTISYQLVDRKAIELPNPVYTCTASGKVVINIEVNGSGNVVKTSYNKAASTTANGCLIDAATEYSQNADFSKDLSKKSQLGTITFNFPGQI